MGDNYWDARIWLAGFVVPTGQFVALVIWGVGGALLLSLLYIVHDNMVQVEALAATEMNARQQTEEALRESEIQFRVLVENVPGAVYQCEVKAPWSVRHMSDGVRLITKHPASAFIDGGLNRADIVIPEDRLHFERAIMEGIENKRPFEIEYRIVNASGDTRWVHEIGRATYDDQGRPRFLTGVIIDATEVKRAEEALRESEARFRAMFQEAGMGIAIVDMEGHPILSNPALQRILGYSGEELRDMVFTDFTHPEDADKDMELYREMMAGKRRSYKMEKRYYRKDGQLVYAYLNVTLIRDAHNEPRFGIGMVEDVTENKKIEATLSQKQIELTRVSRLSTMGEMASRLAHELNQPLSAITHYCDAGAIIINEMADPNADLKQILKETYEQAHRAGEIIRGIRQFVRKEEPSKSPANINRIVSETLRYFEPELRDNGISVHFDSCDNIELMLDRIQIQQVLVNLIRNSIEALESNRAVHKELIVRTKQMDGETIRVTVEDSGHGIESVVSNKLFQPFDATKQSGMGMGLTISRSIIEAHGGILWSAHDIERGARFHFTLPISAAAGVVRRHRR